MTAALLALVAATGCLEAGPSCVPVSPPAVVGVDAEGRFVSATGPVVPRAINSYPLLDHAGHGRWEEIAAILDSARDLGRPVVRTGAYMIGSDHPGRLRDVDGSLREEGLSALDRVLAMAAERDVQLLLITANHWHHYGGAPAVLRAVAPADALPVEAFYSDPRALDHQRRFLRALSQRRNTVSGRLYAEDTTIFAWELINEARCEEEALCDGSTLPGWAAAMATTLRDAGVVQPIAWGGQGFFGSHGEDLDAIARVGGVDILTLHLYPDLAGALTFEPGTGADRVLAAVAQGVARIERAAAIARSNGRALLVEEAGWRARGPARDEERALVLGAWARAARSEGVGFAPWMIGEPGRLDYDGYLIRPAQEPATARVLRCE